MYIDENKEKWYKGNIHTHTTISDGVLSPEEAVSLYRKNNYDFIAITDHWKWNASYQEKDILVISGAEYDFGKSAGDGIYHIVALGCKSEPDIKRDFTPQMAIDAIHASGGITNLAHPAWSLNSSEELMKLKNVDTSEIYNSLSGLPFNCRPYSGLIFDIMASKGCIWNLCAADDTHFYKESDTCRSFIYVNSSSCSEEDIINSIKSGKYYSSQGPRLSVELKKDTLCIKTSPVCEMVFFTDKVYVPDRCIKGDHITYAEYKIKTEESFIRVEVKNKAGEYAWSQYYLTK